MMDYLRHAKKNAERIRLAKLAAEARKEEKKQPKKAEAKKADAKADDKKAEKKDK